MLALGIMVGIFGMSVMAIRFLFLNVLSFRRFGPKHSVPKK